MLRRDGKRILFTSTGEEFQSIESPPLPQSDTVDKVLWSLRYTTRVLSRLRVVCCQLFLKCPFHSRTARSRFRPDYASSRSQEGVGRLRLIFSRSPMYAPCAGCCRIKIKTLLYLRGLFDKLQKGASDALTD